MHTTILALTASLAATSTAFTCTGNYFSFFNRDGNALSYQRIDPALFPGTQSPHLHSFDGGNGLSASTDFAATQDASCSTARVKTDKSLYWRPALFWNGNGTGFHRVPEKSTKIYYKFGDGDKWANVTGFPDNFNMIAGSPMKRSDGDNPAGVRWGCHQPDGRSDPLFANGFPTGFQSCKYGFASEVTFPSCWNGEKLDPKNPNAHMAYPTGSGSVGTDNCPTTHRAARFPTIFIEFWYDVSSFDGQYASDSTGGCNCGCGCGQTEIEQCFGAENVNKDDDTAFEQCSVSGGSSADAATVFDTLPGCNPIQSGPADATAVTGPGCGATPAPGTGGAKTSSSASSPSVTPPAKVSSKAGSSSAADAYSSAVVQDETNTKPSLSLNLPNKGNATPTPTPVTSSQAYSDIPKDATKPTPSASAEPDTPKGTVPGVSSAAPIKPSGAPSGGKTGECKAPVYVTVTPTVYVTAGTNSTACGLGTVTKTLTQTATVTVEPAGGFQYGSY
ncbi:hypothetical protein EK21DRAFT_68461 [Setomelanomma holmii]|uniref:DUF1996 domain-containing protein n=1 Tax=Setomelanomma holmii TaxID=210430 RepID=A0A9P4H7L3_9PLEO|nr:hypothetical protein EK21DRAFT_68461 [Setomelanomma holmii]